MSEHDDAESSENERRPTLLQQTGIRRRMKCSGTVAHQIQEAFVTVSQLVDAVESDEPIIEIDGIGPKTAETIERWYENREERERNMPSATLTERSTNSASIALHSSWADELGIDGDADGGDAVSDPDADSEAANAGECL